MKPNLHNVAKNCRTVRYVIKQWAAMCLKKNYIVTYRYFSPNCDPLSVAIAAITFLASNDATKGVR